MQPYVRVLNFEPQLRQTSHKEVTASLLGTYLSFESAPHLIMHNNSEL